MARVLSALEVVLPVLSGLLLVAVLATVWFGRLWYPFDLEWMEGGMLAHAWRIDQGLPLYVRPNPDFVPFIYPPGYPLVVAALGRVLGLTVVVGRAVSLVSIGLAAAAIAYAVRRAGGSWPISLGSAAVFLGTYPQAGAFYDIVRPDSLGMALAGWAIVIGREERPRAPMIAGLLLAASFLVKQNAAVFGVPMVLALALRGWRPAVQFATAALLPALLVTAVLDWRSHGVFLTWMVAVPASHVMLWERAWVDTMREWGTAMPVAWGAVGLALVVDGMSDQKRLPPWLSAGLPVWLGILAGWWGTYLVPAAPTQVVPFAYSFAYWGLAAGTVAVGIRLAGGLPPWTWIYDLGVLGCAGAMAMVMRVHDSGFVNVHTPLFWCLALTFGTVVARWQRFRLVGASVLAVELLWSAARIDRAQLVPTEADAAVGWRFVRKIEAIEGPVLSPFGAWLPTYAGRPPSLHAMGVWDCNTVGGPYEDDLATIQTALREHRWTVILGGEYRLVGDLTEHYEPREELIPTTDPTFRPKTGWLARPWRILVPRDDE